MAQPDARHIYGWVGEMYDGEMGQLQSFIRVPGFSTILSECYITLITIVRWHKEYEYCEGKSNSYDIPGLILGLRPANERGRYKVTPSLIGWAQT